MISLRSLTPRILAGVGITALVASIGLVSSRPAHTAGGPIPVAIANLPLPTVPTDEAAPKQPFATKTVCVIVQGHRTGALDTPDSFEDIVVPAGERLVIQTVSLQHPENRAETV